MKRYKYYLIIIVIVMIIPILYRLTIKHHEKKYTIGSFEINEIFNIIDNNHTYDFIITKGKETYSFTILNRMNKRSKIIKEIKVYKENNIQCILPVYKNKKESDLYCLKDKNQVSNEILKEDKNYLNILSKVGKKENKENKTKTELENLTIYSNNIPEDNAVIIWNYKGIYVLKNNKNIYQQFLKNDLYDNIMATTTSKYFVLFENTSVNGIDKIDYYDLEKEKYKTWKLEEKISKDSYINGVIKDLIYVTDKDKKKQYTIDIKKKKIIEVGNEEEQYIKYVNNEKTLMKKSDFFMKEQYFQNESIINKKISTSKDIRKESNYYYFMEENSFYKQMEKANRVELFNINEVGEWSIQNGNILLRKEEELYLYIDQNGLRKILEYSELKYNYKNIYYLWK